MDLATTKATALLCILIVSTSSADITAFNAAVEVREAAVRNLAGRVEQEFALRCANLEECGCSLDACQSSLPSAVCDDSIYESEDCTCPGLTFDYDNSVVRLPVDLSEGDSSGQLHESICYSARLETDWQQAEEENPDLDWQGFGSATGMFRIYPGRPQDTCGSYDPRLRSWYAAAASVPKDVVLVLDVSGSMNDNGRLELAKKAAKSLLKTLTFADYVNIVTFDSSARVLGSAKSQLMRAVSETTTELEAAIDDLEAGGATNFEAAIETALDLLGATTGSGCGRAIVFMTDGSVTAGLAGNSLLDAFEMDLAHGGPTLFAYSLGDGADKVLTADMACRWEGLYQHVEDGGDLPTQMSLFYEYFAVGAAIEQDANGTRPVTWVEPFEFATAGVVGTSVSAPVYDFSSNPATLIGVVGTGFPIVDLQETLGGSEDELLNQLLSRSTSCPAFSLNQCQLQALRGRRGEGSLCPGQCTSSLDLNLQTCPGDISDEDAENRWCNTEERRTRSVVRKCCPGCAPLSGWAVAGIAVGSLILIGGGCFAGHRVWEHLEKKRSVSTVQRAMSLSGSSPSAPPSDSTDTVPPPSYDSVVSS